MKNIELQSILNRCVEKTASFQDFLTLIGLTNKDDLSALYQAAYQVKVNEVGNFVRLRGIIEFSNICNKDCLYCGIRKSNASFERFKMSKDEVLQSAEWAYEMNYGSVLLQAGERVDDEFIDFVEDCVKEIKLLSDNKLGITLSLGEQSRDTYARWFAAGAHRYLLRIETSNEELYKSLHPNDHSFDNRKKCLGWLRDAGYQVGTGVMIGFPRQSDEDLINDIMFFKEQDVDMIGMGPYIEHPDTPMSNSFLEYDAKKQHTLALKMIACTRLAMPNINIAASTALQALDQTGREKGLLAGANVIMPNLTDTKYRDKYKLYDGKPCLDENASQCRLCLEGRVAKIGEKIIYNEWGDSPHFKQRQKHKRD